MLSTRPVGMGPATPPLGFGRRVRTVWWRAFQPAAASRRVRAPVEETARQFPVGVGGRDHERALPVRQRVVHVRPRVEQGPRRLDRAGPDREEQRREPGGLGRAEVAPARPRLSRGPHVQVGSELGQRPDRRRVVPRRRPHQRRLSAHLVPPVRIRAGRQQHAHPAGRSRPRRRHQRRLSPRHRRIRVGARRQQHLEHRRAAVGGGERDRLHAVAVGRRHVRARVDQQAGQIAIVMVRRPVQRRRPVDRGRVDVRPAGDQRPNRRRVGRPRRRHQRRIIGGSVRRRSETRQA